MILAYIALPTTGHQATPATVTTKVTGHVTSGHGAGGGVTGSGEGQATGSLVKDDTGGQLMNALFIWLLGWLINGRNLKTTMQKGFKYYLGWQHLICWSGNEVGLRRIWMNVYDADIEESSQSSVWDNGTASLINNPTGITININDDDMFGGVDEGGGFIGDIRVYFGGTAQPNDPWMISQMSLDTVQAELKGLTPKYSSFVTAVIPKAYIGKQASIPSMWFEIVNYPSNLGFDKIGNDVNPAEAIYEIITNSNWGCSESPSRIDIDSLIALGNVCRTESLGISIVIDNSTEAKEVINKILQHINAVKYDDPTTGKLTFKAIREDYELDSLPVFDTSNCVSAEFIRLDWSETVSTTVVSYVDPTNNYETSTVPYNDLANRKITGLFTEKKIDGSYFTTAANAKTLAMQEQMSAGYPLASVKLEVNRVAFNLVIGSPFILRWNPYGIAQMVMRVTDVDYSSLTSGTIKVEAIEDVFGFSKTEYTYGNGTEWTTPEHLPVDIAYKMFFEIPYEISRVKDTYIYSMAVQPSNYTVYWDIWRYIGSNYTVTAKSSLWTTAARMVYGYSEGYAEDAVGFEIKSIGVNSQLDNMIATINSNKSIYNNLSGANIIYVDNEIMSFESIQKLPNGDYQVSGIIRGIYDTLPAQHTAESIVYFMNIMINVNGSSRLLEQGLTSSEQLALTSETLDKSQDLDYNSIIGFTTTRRAEQPSVMANLKFGAYRGIETVVDYHPSVMLSGDLVFKFNQRDKFKLNGILTQLDTAYRGQDLLASNTMQNVLRVSFGAIIKEYKYSAFNITEFTYGWATFCTDFNEADVNSLGIEILTYDTETLLYSFSKYVDNISYNMPVFVGTAIDFNTAQTYANTLVSNTTIVIPESSFIPQTVLTYNSCPLILINNGQSASGIKSQDGIKYDMSTTAYRIVGIDGNNNAILDMLTLDEGYAFKSNFSVKDNNETYHYRVNNGLIIGYSL